MSGVFGTCDKLYLNTCERFGTKCFFLNKTTTRLVDQQLRGTKTVKNIKVYFIHSNTALLLENKADIVSRGCMKQMWNDFINMFSQ